MGSRQYVSPRGAPLGWAGLREGAYGLWGWGRSYGSLLSRDASSPNEPNEEGERPAADGGVPGGRSPSVRSFARGVIRRAERSAPIRPIHFASPGWQLFTLIGTRDHGAGPRALLIAADS